MTGGLEIFLQKNPHITVCLPKSFPAPFKKAILQYGANIIAVKDPTRIFEQVYSSGEMGNWIKEQALILQTPEGLVIITGCAHPGIVNIVRKGHEYFQEEVYLVMGGFHLSGMSDAKILGIIQTLKEIGVKRVAPSHCTGDKAIALFRGAWGDGFVEGGLGANIQIPK